MKGQDKNQIRTRVCKVTVQQRKKFILDTHNHPKPGNSWIISSVSEGIRDEIYYWSRLPKTNCSKIHEEKGHDRRGGGDERYQTGQHIHPHNPVSALRQAFAKVPKKRATQTTGRSISTSAKGGL